MHTNFGNPDFTQVRPNTFYVSNVDLIACPHRCHLLFARYFLRFVLSIDRVCRSSDDSEPGRSHSCLQNTIIFQLLNVQNIRISMCHELEADSRLEITLLTLNRTWNLSAATDVCKTLYMEIGRIVTGKVLQKFTLGCVKSLSQQESAHHAT